MEDRAARSVWWALGIALVGWIALASFLPTDAPRREVAYSLFQRELDARNVPRVDIRGTRLAATLRGGEQRELVTNIPPVTDPSFWPLVRESGAEVSARPEPGRWWLDLALLGLPIALVFLLLSRLGGRSDGQPNAFSFGQSRARVWLPDRPQITFADVAGVDEAKGELQEIVEFLKSPERFHRVGARVPRPGRAPLLRRDACPGRPGGPPPG